MSVKRLSTLPARLSKLYTSHLNSYARILFYCAAYGTRNMRWTLDTL